MLFNGAGGRGAEGRMLVDGLRDAARSTAAAQWGYIADVLGTAEVVTTNSGNLGEQEVGGPTISFIPKSGGNTFKGSASTAPASTTSWSANNITTDLKNRGFTATPATIAKQWDVDGLASADPSRKTASGSTATTATRERGRRFPAITPTRISRTSPLHTRPIRRFRTCTCRIRPCRRTQGTVTRLPICA